MNFRNLGNLGKLSVVREGGYELGSLKGRETGGRGNEWYEMKAVGVLNVKILKKSQPCLVRYTSLMTRRVPDDNPLKL